MDCKINYQYLRPKKATHLKQMHDSPFPCRDSLTATHIPNGTILPLKQFENSAYPWQGGVVDQDGHFVEDSALYTFYGGGYPYDNPITHNGTAVYCGYFIQHWGDFLVQCVPRLWFCLENDNPEYRYVFLSRDGDNPTLRGNFLELISLLGIADRIDILTEPARYTEVIIPEMSYKASLFFASNKYYSPLFKKTFDVIASNISISADYPPPCKKIFLSRSQFGKAVKMEMGLDFLDNYFERNGFTILYPEKTPLSHMIYLIQNAEIFASPSGTLPHNALFGKDGQTIWIVERCCLNNEFQVDINQIKALNATYIDGNLSIYPVELAYGPFVFGYNHIFEQFTKDHGLISPDQCFIQKAYFKKLFRQFMLSYRDEHKYHWYMDDWMIPLAGILYEAYNDNLQYFGEYIHGYHPFLFHHYFSFHYFKQFIKRLLKRF